MSRWLCLALVACAADGRAHVVPAEIAVGDEASPLRIEGLASSDFLSTAGGEVALAVGYRAQIGGVAAVVQAADADGVSAILAAPLAPGSYGVDVFTDSRSWHTDNALTVVDDGQVDAGVDAPAACPAAPSGCSAFACAGSSHCYYVCTAQTGASAAAQCSTNGLGCLVTVDDAAENACLAAATLASDLAPVWIGDQAVSGTWAWDCADGSTYANWKGGSVPHGDGCAQLGNLGTWSSKDCSAKARYVCER